MYVRACMHADMPLCVCTCMCVCVHARTCMGGGGGAGCVFCLKSSEQVSGQNNKKKNE